MLQNNTAVCTALNTTLSQQKHSINWFSKQTVSHSSSSANFLPSQSDTCFPDYAPPLRPCQDSKVRQFTYISIIIFFLYQSNLQEDVKDQEFLSTAFFPNSLMPCSKFIIFFARIKITLSAGCHEEQIPCINLRYVDAFPFLCYYFDLFWLVSRVSRPWGVNRHWLITY